ncbi:MAG TPA: hypothetical protein VK435_03005 [Thermodesulfovibrionales bacterium]|nr:hypothetical protein [Thermodesulfovibrionales bacterium]
MRRVGLIKCLILCLAVASLCLSCGGKESLKSSEDARLADEAFRLADTLRKAYEGHDASTLEENSTKEGYRGLIAAIKKFDRAELSFTPTWVDIKDSTVSLTVSWKGTWTTGGKSTEERGLAIFVLEGHPLKLALIQRENPFNQPE